MLIYGSMIYLYEHYQVDLFRRFNTYIFFVLIGQCSSLVLSNYTLMNKKVEAQLGMATVQTLC